MPTEIIAILCLFAFSVFSFVFGIREYKKEKKEFLGIINDNFNIETLKLHFSEMFNIEQIKEEFQEIVHENMQGAIDAIGESFSGILTDPTVKKAFGIIGSQGGEAKAKNLAVDEMATDMLDGPQFAAIRMGAEALGLDIESYIGKHGAIKTLQAAQQLAQFAGIDLMNLGSLALPGGAGASRGNPYFKR